MIAETKNVIYFLRAPPAKLNITSFFVHAVVKKEMQNRAKILIDRFDRFNYNRLNSIF